MRSLEKRLRALEQHSSAEGTTVVLATFSGTELTGYRLCPSGPETRRQAGEDEASLLARAERTAGSGYRVLREVRA